jgi:cold shock CspA family protein
MQKRFSGTVIWYDADNGHGIIRMDSGNKTLSIDDSQIHHNVSGKRRHLHVGQDVSFEIMDTQARNLYFL